MEKSFLTPIEFNENPELAALRILKTSLEVAHLALVATYPDCEPSCSQHCRSEQEAFAISLLYQIDALSAVLDEYAESIRRLRQPRNREPSTDVAF